MTISPEEKARWRRAPRFHAEESVPRLLDHIEAQERENFRLNEIVQHRFHGTVVSDVAVLPIEDHAAMKAHIEAQDKRIAALERELKPLREGTHSVQPWDIRPRTLEDAAFLAEHNGHVMFAEFLRNKARELRDA